MKVCSVDSCDRPSRARGWCTMHYQRFHEKPAVPVVLTTEQRFMAKIRKDPVTDCWEWTANRRKGYGRFQYGPKGAQVQLGAHRWAYEHFVGPIPPGMLVCHHCDNPPCVNPAHLFPGTGSDNKQDELAKGRSNPPRGRRNPRAVLDEETVRQIRALYVPRKMSYRRIARQLGLGERAVQGVIQGRNWRHLS